MAHRRSSAHAPAPATALACLASLAVAACAGLAAAMPQLVTDGAGPVQWGTEPTIIRERPIAVNPHEAFGLDAAAGDVIEVSFFNDATFLLRLDQEHPRTPARQTGGVTWSGSLADDELGWFVLVVEPEVVVANVWTGDGEAYQIRHTARGTHVAQQLLLDNFDTCGLDHTHVVEPVVRGGDRHARGGPTDGGGGFGCEPDDGSVIDVLVVYTPAARIANGGTAGMEALAEAAIASTNVSYENSDIMPRVRMVHVAEVDYTESGCSTDLGRLRSPADGFMTEVHGWRNEYAADLVALLSTSPGCCGVAYLMRDNSLGFADSGFSLTRHDCAVGNLTFAHELGHNQGACHAPGDGGGCNSGGLYHDSLGHRYFGTSGQQWRTVMAYTPGTRTPRFSSPNVIHDGTPTGIANERDNVRTLNDTALTISNFRNSEQPIWSDLAGGFDAPAHALLTDNDTIIAGGAFSHAGGTPAAGIARWDGESWQPFGDGIDGTVKALAIHADQVIAAGDFAQAGGTPASNIAAWDGQTWTPLADGLDGTVRALAVHNGDLIAGGEFTSAGGQPAARVARWDGNAWHPLGGGVNNTVHALASHGGTLHAGGEFTSPAARVARWTGGAWQSMGAGFDDTVHTLISLDTGLFAAGAFTRSGSINLNRAARWMGQWRGISQGLNGTIYTLGVAEEHLIAGGDFSTGGHTPASNVARLGSIFWFGLGQGANNAVHAVAEFNNQLIIAGDFTEAGGEPIGHIARWACQDTPTCIADWNGDGEVDINDLFAYLDDFESGDPRADLNQDGEIDINDFFMFLTEFEAGC